jgi:hypothetical protein
MMTAHSGLRLFCRWRDGQTSQNKTPTMSAVVGDLRGPDIYIYIYIYSKETIFYTEFAPLLTQVFH